RTFFMPARMTVRRGKVTVPMLLIVAAAGYGAGAGTVWLARVGPVPAGQPELHSGSARSAVAAPGGLRPARLLSVVGPPADPVPDHELSTQQLHLAQTRADVQSGQVALQKARAAHQNALKVAHAQLAAAQANQKFARADQSGKALEQKLALAQLQLDRTTLKAPWAGRVLKLSAVPGEATGPPQPILQLADTGTMLVVAEVSETDVKQLRAWRQ